MKETTRAIGDGTCCICGTPLHRGNAVTCNQKCRTTLFRARRGQAAGYRVDTLPDGTQTVTRTLPRPRHHAAAERLTVSARQRLDGMKRDIEAIENHLDAMSGSSAESFMGAHRGDLQRMAQDTLRLHNMLEKLAEQKQL